jgi:hypothetical protein
VCFGTLSGPCSALYVRPDLILYHIFRATILHTQNLTPTCSTSFFYLLVNAPERAIPLVLLCLVYNIYDHIKNNFDLVSTLLTYGFVVKFKYVRYFVLVVFW